MVAYSGPISALGTGCNRSVSVFRERFYSRITCVELRAGTLETHWEGVFSSNEDSNSKIVFALIAIQLNPIESKLLGRIAAKAQQQQRAHQIDRRLTLICARKTQICARKTQICARKKGF